MLSVPVVIRLVFVGIAYALFGTIWISIILLLAFVFFHESTRFLFRRYGLRNHPKSTYYFALFGLWLPVYLFSHLLVLF